MLPGPHDCDSLLAPTATAALTCTCEVSLLAAKRRSLHSPFTVSCVWVCLADAIIVWYGLGTKWKIVPTVEWHTNEHVLKRLTSIVYGSSKKGGPAAAALLLIHWHACVL